jgi:hypothetical protein
MKLRRIAAAGAIAAGILALWIGLDFAGSSRHDLRQFDGREVGNLETAMWRSYYEHRPVRLFWQATELLRRQFHLPFWKSCAAGYYAAHSAVTFQAGHSHAEYRRAVPDLKRYYSLIREASTTPFDVDRTAELELDWWIVHRERAQHTREDLYRGLARLQAAIYGLPEERFVEHARTRGDAMLLRDERASSISENDWRKIGELLDRSWTSLHHAVAP